MSSDQRLPRLRWWRYVGPWPLRAWIVFWGAGAVLLIVATAAQRELLIDHPLRAAAEVFLPALAGSAAMAAVVLLGSHAFPGRAPASLAVYLLFILGSTGIGSLVHFAASRLIGVATIDDIVYTPFLAARLWVWAVFLLAVAGVTVRRMSYQTRLAEEALAASREQQQVMLINEERSRRQVSALLHDRVQAGLMAVCLELRMAAGRDGGITAGEIESAITRLDEIRGLDVRAAARALSPDLANVDLRSALTELARIYEPGMMTTIDIDPQIAMSTHVLHSDLLLAAYRVVEQGLLNAVVHGHATHARVSVTLLPMGEVHVEVSDDGRAGMPNGEPGFGSAVIDAWCRVLGGRWSLEVSREGATLSAHLPVGGLSQV